jgi:hypothetical protein
MKKKMYRKPVVACVYIAAEGLMADSKPIRSATLAAWESDEIVGADNTANENQGGNINLVW